MSSLQLKPIITFALNKKLCYFCVEARITSPPLDMPESQELVGQGFRRSVPAKEKNPEKISLRSQIILALIPSFVTQIIAFYRVRKLLNGIIMEVIIFFLDLVIQMIISWPFGMIFSLPITIGIPVYYIRKWTIEFNNINRSLF